MTPPPITVRVDRDSVAMGDDVMSHTGVLQLPDGTFLSAMLDAAAPEIRARGWSWVAVVDGAVSAVWSVDHGVRLLVADRRLHADRAMQVHFRYFVQIDPAWLWDRLNEGARADRRALEALYAPIAREKRERELRRQEKESPARLLSPACIQVLRALGAALDLHADVLCRFDLNGERWTVRRADTMTQIFRGTDAGPVASIRPISFAECWLVAAVAADARALRGLARVPEYDPLPAPELRPMHSFPGDAPRWTTSGELIAQLSGADAVEAFRIAVGRGIPEILARMEPLD